MDYGDKPILSTNGHAKYPRDVDMANRVRAVFASTGYKLALGVFDNDHIRAYVQGLDEKHSSPYRLEHLRILEVMMDGGMIKFLKTVKVRHRDRDCAVIAFFYISHIINIFSCR